MREHIFMLLVLLLITNVTRAYFQFRSDFCDQGTLPKQLVFRDISFLQPLIRDISKRDSLLQRVLLCVVVDQISQQPSELFGKRKEMKRDLTSLVNSKSLWPLTQRCSFDAAN